MNARGFEMEERSRRIVDTAIELANNGGYEAVRLRDVAADAGVALGTVYKRFQSKEEILLAALEKEVGAFNDLIRQYPLEGPNPEQRVTQLFALATSAMCQRENFARAVLRAAASGEPGLTERITRFHTVITNLIEITIEGPEGRTSDPRVAYLLQQIWFAALVGWMGGLHDEDSVVDQMRFAVTRLLAPLH